MNDETEEQTGQTLQISELTQRVAYSYADSVHVVTSGARELTALTFLQIDPLLYPEDGARAVTAIAKVMIPLDVAKYLNRHLEKSIELIENAQPDSPDTE